MNKKILIGILLALILVLIFSFLSRNLQEAEKGVKITTDKTEYSPGEAPVITIKNNLADNVCFSSCYPYYLEKNNGQWQKYPYQECDIFDSVKDCIELNSTKDLELSYKDHEFVDILLPGGLYRVVVPFCINCQVDDAFREDQRFYSNEFTIGQ